MKEILTENPALLVIAVFLIQAPLAGHGRYEDRYYLFFIAYSGHNLVSRDEF
jgi:hypothetical protein